MRRDSITSLGQRQAGTCHCPVSVRRWSTRSRRGPTRNANLCPFPVRRLPNIGFVIGSKSTGIASDAMTPAPERFRHLCRSGPGCGRVRRPVGVSLQPARVQVSIDFLHLMQVSTLGSGWWMVFRASCRGFCGIRMSACSGPMTGCSRRCSMAGAARCSPAAWRSTRSRPVPRVVGRFQVFTGDYPWTWRPVDVEDFLAEMRSRSRPIGLTTLRSYSNAVSMFCAYLTHPGYGWGELCERTFGNVPARSASTGIPRATPPTTPYRQHGDRSHKPSSSSCSTTSTTSSTASTPPGRSAGCQRCGTRSPSRPATPMAFAAARLTMLDLNDFGPNPHLSDVRPFGATTVRWAKGTTASGPRRRTVLTVPEFAWVGATPGVLGQSRGAWPVPDR